MEYSNIVAGRFVSRPNRFIAYADVGGQTCICHVRNTGRCRELLVPGAEIWLEKSNNPARKTGFSLVTVQKPTGNGPILINIDSQAPNKAFEEAAARLFPQFTSLRREVTYGGSRFDFLLESASEKMLVEVKGVTLENGGIARFPDAPTERGVRHVRELVSALEHGYRACVFFAIQMKGVHAFAPNDATDPAFGKALREAANAGVGIIAYDCEVNPGSMSIAGPVEIIL